jgi:pimeloyl-ACP methyl ester carboxylesterase
MTQWSEGDVTANGIRLHYYRTGASKPPVVLSHGYSDSGLCWPRVAAALEADYEVIAYDARGHGRSEAPDEGYTSEDRAADLAGLIQALGLAKPALIGHSMGASTTLYTAALYPDLVGRAVLEDGGPRGASRLNPAFATTMAQRSREQREMTQAALIALCRAESPSWDEAELAPWAEAKRLLSPKAIGRPWGTERLSWQDAIARVACPILLITADNELGSGVTPEVAVEAQRLQPRLEVVHIPGAGHNVRREQFATFVETVRAFLARL